MEMAFLSNFRASVGRSSAHPNANGKDHQTSILYPVVQFLPTALADLLLIQMQMRETTNVFESQSLPPQFVAYW